MYVKIYTLIISSVFYNISPSDLDCIDARVNTRIASRLQHHPSSEDIIIIPENEYCQSNQMNIYLFCIYAYKGLLMVS